MLCCQHLLQAGFCVACWSPRSSLAKEGLQKQLLNKGLIETFTFFFTSETEFSTFVCQNSEMDSAFLFRILSGVFLALTVLC